MKTLEQRLAMITSRRATNLTPNNILTDDFSAVIHDFFSENFDMYVTVEKIGNHCGHMRILSEYTFEFLKKFLLSVLGRHTIKIKLYTKDDDYVMELFTDGIRDMDIKERTSFIRLAHKAGFKMHIGDGFFQLYTRYQQSDFMRVHAINIAKIELQREMSAMFFYN